MKTFGRISQVYPLRSGSSASRAISSGSSSVWVDSTGDFNEAGGECVIRKLSGDYSTYSYTLGQTGTNEDQLLISPVLEEAILAGQSVATKPITDVMMANVLPVDGLLGTDGNAMVCEVDYPLTTSLTYGFRQADKGEFVEISDESGTLKVVSIRGEKGVTQASTLEGPNESNPMADGEPPLSAPVVHVTSFAIKAIRAWWSPIENHDPVVYKVYASLTSPVVVGTGSYVGQTSGDYLVISKLTDGSEIPVNTPVYVVVVPEDDDGVGPASVEVSGSPRAATNGDISAEYVYAGEIEASQINAGSIFSNFAAVDRIETSSSNPRVTMDSFGLKLIDGSGSLSVFLPTDASQPAAFNGKVSAKSISVEDRLSMRGVNNEFSSGATLRLAAGVTTPTAAPVVSVSYPSNSMGDVLVPGDRGLKKFSNGKWYSFSNSGGKSRIWERTEDANGNLQTLTAVVTIVDDGVYGARIHDFVERSGKMLVLLEFGPSSSLGSVRTDFLVYQYAISGWAYESYRSVTLAQSDKKAAMCIRSSGGTNHVIFLRPRSNGPSPHQWYLQVYEVPTSGSGSASLITSGDTNMIVDDHVSCVQEVQKSTLTGTGSGWVLATKREGWPGIYVIDGNPLNRYLDHEWTSPAGSGATSVWWDGTQWHAANSGRIWHLSNFKWVGAEDSKTTRWARFSWFDNNSGGTGKHETLVSPAQSFQLSKMAHFQVTTPPIPSADISVPADSVSGVRIYVNPSDSATEPGVSTYSRTSVDPADGATSVVFGSAVLPGTGLPPNTGSPAAFPSATPAQIQSASGGFVIKGDGTGSWPALRPVGEITMFGGATAPAGWMLCDGAAISRTTYATLFAILGTTYGAGNGSTTFNLPNMTGRMPAMPGDQIDVMGTNGGANDHYHRLPHGFDGNFYGWKGGSGAPIFGSEVISGAARTYLSGTSDSGAVRIAYTEAKTHIPKYTSVNFMIRVV